MTNDWATMDTGYCLVHTKLLLNYFAKVKSNKMKTNVTKSQSKSKSKQTNAIQNTPNLHENLNNMLSLRNGHAYNKNWKMRKNINNK